MGNTGIDQGARGERTDIGRRGAGKLPGMGEKQVAYGSGIRSGMGEKEVAYGSGIRPGMGGRQTAYGGGRLCIGRSRRTVKALCLALSISAATTFCAWASPDFAYTPEKWAALRDNVLEYDELADLIHEYNATVINNRLQYDQYRGKSNDDMKNAYQDMADKLSDSSDKMLDLADEDSPGYGSIVSGAIGARLSAEQNQDLADSQDEDGYVKKLGYEQQEASLVKEAQSKMNAYWQKMREKPALLEAVSQAQSKYQSMTVKADQGMATQADLLSAREEEESAQAAVQTNEKDGDALRRDLCVMTGWSYDARPDIHEIPIPDESQVNAIDLGADKEKAKKANYTQAANERRLKYSGTGAQYDVMESKVENGRSQIEADVEAKYKLLKQAQADYDQSRSELVLAVNQAQAAERRYNLGAISKNNYLQQRSGLASKQSASDVAALKFSQAMEDYRWAVNGLAQTEGS